MQSPKRSWKDFRLSKNLRSALKKCIYVMVPAILTELVAHNLLIAGLAGIIGSSILNAVEFYFSDVETK